MTSALDCLTEARGSSRGTENETD